MKRAIVIICASIFITGCVGDNTFEKAFNPLTGNTKALNAWKDKGGLDGENNYYGLAVSQVRYSFDASGAFRSMQAKVSSGASPERMRSALSKACKISTDKFEIINTSDAFGNSFTAGTGRSPQVSCIYERSRQGNTILLTRLRG